MTRLCDKYDEADSRLVGPARPDFVTFVNGAEKDVSHG